MINLNVFELDKIRKICEEVDTEETKLLKEGFEQ
jgi:hypothetical protein